MLPSFLLPRQVFDPGPAVWPRPRLGWVLALAAVLVTPLLAGGCITAGEAQRRRVQAMEEGRQKAMEEQLKQEPAVFFVGDVRNGRVPWQEGITLAEGLAAAQYTWNWDPHLIKLTRQGEVRLIQPRRLLRGLENPVLEPGDLVEVRH